MTMHKELGKITSAKFGFGGYQDAQVVFELRIGGQSWGSCKTFECGWGHVTKADLAKPGSSYKWTHESRIKGIGEAGWDIVELLKKAKKKSLDELVGVPIEAFFDGPCGRLMSIRVLEEVL